MSVSLIQLTDVHLARPKNYIAGTGNSTHDTLDRVLEQVSKEDVDAVLCTGDITDTPSEAAYRDAFERLAKLTGPVFCLPGNHDDSAMAAPLAREYQLQWVEQIQLPKWQVLFLDSTLAGETHGHLNDDRLQQLDLLLEKSLAPHSLVVLHHHPVPVGSRWMDRLMLDNPDALFEILDRHESVRGILWGHIHQSFDHVRKGVRLLGSPSTCRQFTPLAEDFQVDQEKPPAFRRLRLSPTGEIETEVHYCR